MRSDDRLMYRYKKSERIYLFALSVVDLHRSTVYVYPQIT